MIKIKSITDVITNSSSEVYLVKIDDLEEARKIKEVYNKCFVSDEVNLLNRFLEFRTMDDLEHEFNHHPENDVFKVVKGPYSLLRETYLSWTEKHLLHEFGHSDEEIQEWINKKEAERKKARDESEGLKFLVGKAAIDIFAHDHSLDDFKDWLEKNGKDFTHNVS